MLLKFMAIVLIISLSIPVPFVFANPASPKKEPGLDPRPPASSESNLPTKTPCEIWTQSLPNDTQEKRVCTDLYEGLPIEVLNGQGLACVDGPYAKGIRDPQTGKIRPADPSKKESDICYAVLSGTGIQGFQGLVGAIYYFASLAIGILGVLMIIVAGIQITIGGASPDQVASGKKRIIQIIAGMVLFYMIGAILRALNPSFFT